MANQGSSSYISYIYKSRKYILELCKLQSYDVTDYEHFSINEINVMTQNKQLDMLLEKNEVDKNTNRKNKIYIRYYLAKSIRPQNIIDMIEDLYQIEKVLNKDDTLYIIIKENMNETIMNLLKHTWETDGIFIIIQNIKGLQYNVLNNILVPNFRIMNNEEVNEIKNRYNITNNNQFPEISRFDPVSQAIFLRPGQVCEIIRPSKTAILSKYYRICV